MASKYCSPSLLGLRDFLESSPASKLPELLEELSKKRILDRGTKGRLEWLDERLEQGIVIRYVIQTLNERAEKESKLCDKIGQFLQRHSIGVIHHKDTHNRDDVLLDERDVSLLTEFLTPGSYKWEEIAIAVGLPKHIRDDCGKGSSNVVKLGNVLTAWIVGGRSSQPATLKNLKDSLLTNTVDLAQLANSLVKFQGLTDTSGQHCSQSMSSTVEIIEDPFDTEVSEGASTLLEVQVNSVGQVSYQWLKNGKEISESDNYSGTSAPIIFVGQCSQHSQGLYSCFIKSGHIELRSEAAKLSIKFTQEKCCLLKCYTKIYPQDPWPPISNTAFHTLVLHEKTKCGDEETVLVTESMEKSLDKERTMSYKEAFCKFYESSLVIIEGRPGSGKTTLVYNLLRDWANGENILIGSKLIVLVTLRITQCNDTLKDFLKVFYSDESMCRKLAEIIEASNGKDMCFILDGWDEYQYKDADSIVNQLLHKKYLACSMVVVTSRPVALTDELKSKSNTRIEVIGFTQNRILEYVQTYPFQEVCREWKHMASKLTAYLQDHVNVFQMCYLPLHASIICYLYAKNEGNIPTTETKIYEAFTIATILRKLKRDNKHYVQIKSLLDLEDDVRKHFLQICQLAFDMTVLNPRQTISRQSVYLQLSSSVDVNSDNFSLGLLTVQNMSATYGDDQLCSFHHLSFQEFLAAYHLTQLCQDLQDYFIPELIEDRGCENVLKYYFGVKVFKGTANKIFQELSSNSNDLDLIYFAFESQQPDVCSSFAKFKKGILKFCNSFLTFSDFRAISYVVSESCYCITEFQFRHCYADNNIIMLRGKNWQYVKCLQFDDKSKCKEIIGLMKEHVELLDIQISEVNLRYILDNADIHVPNLKILKIDCLNPSYCFYHLIPILKFGSKNLEQIYFRSKSFRDLKVIKAAINAHFGFECYSGVNCPSLYLCSRPEILRCMPLKTFAKLVEISLVNCEVDDNLVVCLSGVLKKSSHLVTLELDYNKISDDGAINIAEHIMTLPSINTISLQCNSIGNTGAIAVAASIGHQRTSLRTLDLQGNFISDEGAVAIARAAVQLPLLNIHLCNVEVTEIGMEECMKFNKNLNFKHLLNSSWKSIEESNSKIKALTCGKSPAIELLDKDILMMYPQLYKILHNIITLRLTETFISKTIWNSLLFPTSLKHLYLHSVRFPSYVSEQLFHAVSNCKNLQTISLVKTLLFTNIWEALECLESLSKVDVIMSGTEISVHNVYSLCKKCLNLRELNLSYNTLYFSNSTDNLEDIHIQVLDLNLIEVVPHSRLMFELLKHCNHLHCLNLSGSLKGLETIEYGLKHLVTLKELQMHHNQIGEDNLVLLSTIISRNCNLQVLNLHSNNINSNGAHILSQALASATKLESLNLSNNPLSSEGVYYILDGLKCCSNLQYLGLANVALDDVGATVLSNFQCGTNLQDLELSFNFLAANKFISDEEDVLPEELLIAISFPESYGFQYLSEGIRFCCNLRSLFLAKTGMNQHGIMSLVESLKTCHNLKYIDLSHNPLIDSKGLLILLEGLQHLNKLDLDFTNSINSSCVDSLNSGETKKCCDTCRQILRIYFLNDFLSIKISSSESVYIPNIVAMKEIF